MFEFKGSHKHYDSINPCQNKLLARKYEAARYEAHRKRVGAAKQDIDNGAPKTYMHLHVKLKKIQLEEERLAVIERDNRMLLEKMSKIMRTQGQVDHRNEYEHKSINRRTRQYELLRITQENQAILKRIQARKPDIDTEALSNDFSKSEHYAGDLTHFPTYSPTRTVTRTASKETQRLGEVMTKQMPDDGDADDADAGGDDAEEPAGQGDE